MCGSKTLCLRWTTREGELFSREGEILGVEPPAKTCSCLFMIHQGQHRWAIPRFTELSVSLSVLCCWRRCVSAAGCADVVPPRHTWMRRSGDTVEVGCPTTRKRWTLACVGGQWDTEVDEECPGVPGVGYPGDINIHAQSARNGTESFLSAFPTSKLSRVESVLYCM